MNWRKISRNTGQGKQNYLQAKIPLKLNISSEMGVVAWVCDRFESEHHDTRIIGWPTEHKSTGICQADECPAAVLKSGDADG
ncbi:hypothetical protein [Vacuolonema iberomarrocanum]|uniref:hypothetical protein n=1 Tax=Vacuolonema iberomarrocanum TaxID=3454632 RepID=UPI003F6E1C8D